MLTSLALIFLSGLAMAAVCQRLKLPRIIGMLITGIVLSPYVLNLLDPSILGISADLRQMALIIILLKAGLSLNLSDLKKVGRQKEDKFPSLQKEKTRVFDTSVIKNVPLSLVIGLFFCQLFCFII